MNSRFYGVEIFIDNAYAMDICTSFALSPMNSVKMLCHDFYHYDQILILCSIRRILQSFIAYMIYLWLGRIDVIYVAAT